MEKSMKDGIVELPDGAKAYEDSQPGSCGLAEVYDVEVYEKHFKVQRGMVVLDAGACVGMFTLKATRIVGDEGFVVAVEPHAEAFHWLSKNVQLNGYKNVACVNAALWNNVGFGKLSFGWLGASSLVRTYGVETQSVFVGTVTPDYLKRMFNLERVDFLKVDTEGAEVPILEGFTPNPNQFISLESHGDDDAIQKHLEGKGFKVQVEKRKSVGTSMVYACNVEGVL